MASPRIIGKDVVDGKPKNREPEEDREHEGKGAVLVLAGGPAGGGDNSRKRKAYASAVILGVSQPAPNLKEMITFSAEDAIGLSFPHDDAPVIHADVDGYTVHRILVDNGAAPDVLFYNCFLKMTNLSTEIKPVATPLFGFSGTPVTAEGSIRLKVTLGTRPQHVTVEVDFLIVKVKSAYNAIFGRGLLGKLGGVPSTCHQKLKFPTPNGVGEVVRSQAEARLCYVNSIKAKEPAISEYVPLADDAIFDDLMAAHLDPLLAMYIFDLAASLCPAMSQLRILNWTIASNKVNKLQMWITRYSFVSVFGFLVLI
ncbi:hypothetical protein Taro_051379 [Colocasia esculenta]|uniref:Uncharacterized protein n=1 Tax=Colocasia esculenta TaxID=4460 RepID=A0A843XGN6_COLES|nr:hypothetical protein [Colocasia esculenta]